MSKKKEEMKEINGFTVPNFSPTKSGILIPKLGHVIIEESDDKEVDELTDTEIDIELSADDFQTTCLAVSPDVTDKRIKPGAKIQIMPAGEYWYINLELEGEEYWLIKENIVIGIVD